MGSKMDMNAYMGGGTESRQTHFAYPLHILNFTAEYFQRKMNERETKWVCT